MAIEKLKKLAQELKSKSNLLINVADGLSLKTNYILKDINQAYLDKNANGDLLEFTESLREKGYPKLVFCPYYKVGSGYKSAGILPITIDFSTSTTPNPLVLQQNPSGLNGGLMGLSMPQIMDGYAAIKEVENLRRELAQAKGDLKEEKEKKNEYRDKVNKLERKNERYEYQNDIKREPGALDRLIEGIAEKPELIPSLVGMFKGQGAGAALNAPAAEQTAQEPSDMHAKLFEALRTWPPKLLQHILTVTNKIANDDDKATFVNQLTEFINTTNLTKVHNG